MGVIVSMVLLGVFVVVVGFILVSIWREEGGDRLKRAERKELALARGVIANVKELAYEYRDLDSNLSYRLLDTIKEYEARKGSR